MRSLEEVKNPNMYFPSGKMASQKEQLEVSANALKDSRLRLPCRQELLNQEGNLMAPLDEGLEQ